MFVASKSTAFFRRNDPVSGIQSWSKTQFERSAVVRLFGSSSSPVPQSPLLNSNVPDKQSNFPAFKQTDTDPDIIRVNASANESQPCSEVLRTTEKPETTPKRLPPPVIPQRKSSFHELHSISRPCIPSPSPREHRRPRGPTAKRQNPSVTSKTS